MSEKVDLRYCILLAIKMSSVTQSFKAKHPLEERKKESARILLKYPDRIPIIVQKATGADIPDLDKIKYLCPMDLTMGQFLYVIRKRVKLPEDQAIFLFVNNQLVKAIDLLSHVYKTQADDDGFLYVTYQGEATFGGQ